MDEIHSTSTPPSPEKKKKKLQVEGKSAIRTAIQMTGKAKQGLMKFFQPCTKEEYAAQVQRFTEEHHEDMEKREGREVEAKARRDEKVREGERLRQEKHRRLKCDNEITRGVRSPGGTKRRVCCMMSFTLKKKLSKAFAACYGRTGGHVRIIE